MYTREQLRAASLDDVLEGQYGALARWQAHALGMSDDAFDRRLRSGALEWKHKGVAIARAWRHHELAPLAAAVLRAGPGAHLSLWSAAGLLRVDLQGTSELHHLWVPHVDRRPSPENGLELRRSRALTSSLDVTIRKDLPVTTVERLVVDRMAKPMTTRDREGLVAGLLQKGRTTEKRLAACAARRLEGARVLRNLLSVVVGHDSVLEVELDRHARSVDVICEPLVTIVHPDGTQDEVDLLVLASGVVLEADGWAFHSDPAQREADEQRDERLRRLGLIVLRFTTRQIREEPEQCRRRIARACEGRRWRAPAGVVVRLQNRAAA